jgi:hypothetical protein
MMQPELSIMTPERFASTIEKTVIEKNMTYLDAIMHVCDTTGLEVEVIPRLLSPRIKKILTSEANGLNLLKRKPGEVRLPI